MKMINRNIRCIVASILGMVAVYGCNDSFMDRYPETNIVEKLFFKSVKDLELYTNGMYSYLGASYWDVGSDNMLYTGDVSVYRMMRGEVSPKNIGSWSSLWPSVRTVNFMISRAWQVEGDPVEINHYVGIARLFRASLYYSLVKTYSDVPWYSRDLTTADTDLLYKPQDPRSLVVDSVMADLSFAAKNVRIGTSRTRIFKNAALAFQARIALNEGTYRKYHPELGLKDGDRFLNIAVEVCKEIMDTKEYALSQVSEGAALPYASLFHSLDLTQNPEMILMQQYDKLMGIKHNAQSVFDWTSGLSRDLMEDYLVIDGDKAFPFQQLPGYATKNYLEVFENRDSRLAQTFMPPGFQSPGSIGPYHQSLGLGGYPQIKFYPCTYDQLVWKEAYTDLPLIRYAEILLIYAEAKAELGKLTQEDLNMSINLIRDRSRVPRAVLTDWMAQTDPVQEKRYSNVTSSQKSAVLEVRRERRVELACEGFRQNDLKRWACGSLLEKAPEGIYMNQLGMHDISGDGLPDVAVVATKQDAEEFKNKNLTVYILEDKIIELSQGNKGYIYLAAQRGKFKFEEPKYYYCPLDEQDIVINENLFQNQYWK